MSAPIGWLNALARGWPLRCPWFLAHSEIEEAKACGLPHSHSDGDPATPKSLLYEHLRLRSRGESLESIQLLVHSAWHKYTEALGHKQPRPTALAAHLRAWAQHITEDGHADTATLFENWRWATLIIPQNLIIGFAPPIVGLSKHGPELPRQLRERLERHGVVNTHVHLGSGGTFEHFWNELCANCDQVAKFESNTPYTQTLLAAGALRPLLGVMFDTAPRGNCDVLTSLEAGARDRDYDTLQQLRMLIRGAQCGNNLSQMNWEELPFHVRTLIDHQSTVFEFANWATDSRGRSGWDNELIRRAAATSCNTESTINECALNVFWWYQRIRCIAYGRYVHEPGTSGAKWFSKTFRQLYRKGINWPTIGDIIDLESQRAPLFSIEVRVPLGDAKAGLAHDPSQYITKVAEELRKRIEGPDCQNNHKKRAAIRKHPEVALVFSVLRHKGASYARPGKNRITGVRFRDWLTEIARPQLRKLTTRLERDPKTLILVRGLDACGSELDVPMWAIAPLYLEFRHSARMAMQSIQSDGPEWEVRRPCCTIHAGENYNSLHQGLRHVYEAITLEIVQSGDRIGHALAVGENVHEWVRRHPLIRMSREDRLMDLAWELHMYATGVIDDTDGRSVRVAGCISQLMARCPGSPLHSAGEIARAVYEYFMSAPARFKSGVPSEVLVDSEQCVTDELGVPLRNWLRDDAMAEELLKPVECRIDGSDARFLARTQAAIRALLARKEIVIEVNPSSNLLIGDFGDIANLPAFRISGLNEDHENACVGLTLNDDDPLLFATSLGDEYAYTYAALLRAGKSSVDALDWIGACIEAGHSARFSDPLSTEPQVLRLL